MDTKTGRKMDRQYDAADAAIERVVTAFIGRIDKMMGQWDEVHPWHVLERLLLRLCDLLSRLIDTSGKESEAAIKLSNALSRLPGQSVRRSLIR